MNPWVQPTSTSGFNPPSPGSTRTIRVQPAISGFNPHYPGTDKPSHPRVIPRGSLPRCTRAYPAPPVPVPDAPQSISVPNPMYRIPPVLHNIRRHHNTISHPRQGKWDHPPKYPDSSVRASYRIHILTAKAVMANGEKIKHQGTKSTSPSTSRLADL